MIPSVSATLCGEIAVPSQVATVSVAHLTPSATFTLSGTSLSVGQVVNSHVPFGHANPSESVSLQIDWGDGQMSSDSGYLSGSFDFSHTYSSEGTYDVTLTATDSDSQANDGPQTVDVTGSANEDWSLSCTLSDTTAEVSQSVSMSCNFGQPGASESVSLQIDWGDGTTHMASGTLNEIFDDTHAYSSEGSYDITVTATDDDETKDEMFGIATATLTVDSISKPVVSITVAERDEVAYEHGAASTKTSKYILARTGDTSASLLVKIKIHTENYYGVATYAAGAYDDYELTDVTNDLTGYYVTIPAGQGTKEITLTTIADSFTEEPEEAKIEVIEYWNGNTPYDLPANADDASASVSIVFGDPTVSIKAIDAEANEVTLDKGTYRLSRTGDTSEDLQVKIEIGGTANYFAVYYDYTLTNVVNTPLLPTGVYVTIPAGMSFVDITLNPVADSDNNEEDEDATITIVDHSVTATPYAIGEDSNATVTISSDHPCGEHPMTVTAGDTCLVVSEISAVLAVSIKQVTASEPITQDTALTDDILAALGLSPAPSDPATNLWEQLQEWAAYAWDTVADVPVAFQDFAQLMIPTINSASGMIESIEVDIRAYVTGTIYEWNGNDWVAKEPFTTGIDPGVDIAPITLYSRMKTLPLNPNVFEPAGAKEFVTEMQGLFLSIATDLQTTPVNAVDVVQAALQSKAKDVVILGHEDE